LEVNEDAADRNPDGLTGQRKRKGNWIVDTGGRMSKIEGADDIACGSQGPFRAVQPMTTMMMIS